MHHNSMHTRYTVLCNYTPDILYCVTTIACDTVESTDPSSKYYGTWATKQMTAEPNSHTCCSCRALMRGRVLLEREALGTAIPLPGAPFLMERSRVRLLPPRETCEGIPAKVKEQPGPQLEGGGRERG